jgi:uncharacterized integral membrane protein
VAHATVATYPDMSCLEHIMTRPVLTAHCATHDIIAVVVVTILTTRDLPMYLLPKKKGRDITIIYLLTAIGLTHGGSSTVHIYTQTIHRTTQLTTLFGRFSGIRTQSGQNKINDKLTA